jgi:hypothetical protein
MDLLAAHHGAMSDLVSVVPGTGVIPKILDSIVSPDPIVVADFHVRGDRSQKNQRDHSVDLYPDLPAIALNRCVEIAMAICRRL